MYRFVSPLIAVAVFVHLVQAQETVNANPERQQGEHVIRYVTTDGKNAVIRIPTLTKFAPAVASDVRWDPDARVFIYEYDVRNGDRSLQHIGRIEMTLNGSIQVGSPTGWDHERARTGFARWSAVSEGTGREVGIGPGSGKTGFQIRSRFLPGLTLARLRGHGSAPYIPLTAPQDVSDQVTRFAKQDVLHVQVIAPVIPPEEVSEPDSKATLIAHLQFRFREWLSAEHHPNAAAILNDLEDASRAAREARQDDLESALERSRTKALVPVRSQSLADVTKAFALCIEYLLKNRPL